MTRKFKLLKDTPRTKAGATIKLDGSDFYQYASEYPYGFITGSESFPFYVVVNNPNWFEEIIEPEFVLMSPCVFNMVAAQGISPAIFPSAETAKAFYGHQFVSWPATQVIEYNTMKVESPIHYNVPVKK